MWDRKDSIRIGNSNKTVVLFISMPVLLYAMHHFLYKHIKMNRAYSWGKRINMVGLSVTLFWLYRIVGLANNSYRLYETLCAPEYLPLHLSEWLPMW